ncbi:hypothetical protein JYU34_009984 [Plutella xylostella]|uniref:Uncharacterized protein n=2 Tax=Plutella xylostella TaxID=51655 RepID=A0ABQ7QHH6_PLUXY|nr:cytochrome b5 [Plutella xylostella]KAG7304644.1 hypothetical protein JYU34_009984 [Plutella xylostella]CAG9128526.1 unnamed protein product [Plutella xylostella]
MTEVRRFTRAEVRESGGGGGGPTWIIYRDGVYDVSKYLQEHPGGEELVAAEAGTDASEAFSSVGHSADAYTVLARLKIGELVEEEKRYDENGKKKKLGEERGGGCLSAIFCGLC